MRNQTSKIILTGFILVMIGIALPLFGFGLPTPLAVVSNPAVRIVDVQGSPISGAYILLYEGGGYINGVEVYEDATITKVTDAAGYAYFEISDVEGEGDIVSGFYGVGVIKNGYTSYEECMLPNEEYQHIWSAFGAGGFRRDSTYTIKLIYTGIEIVEPEYLLSEVEPEPTTPEPTEPTPIPSEPQTVAYSALNYVTFAGVGLIVAGAVLGRKHK